MADAPDKAQQRKTPRITVTPKSDIFYEDKLYRALVQDLSDGGMLLLCTREFAPGTIIGVHYRGTDKSTEHPLVPYTDFIDRLRAETPVKTKGVLLAWDPLAGKARWAVRQAERSERFKKRRYPCATPS